MAGNRERGAELDCLDDVEIVTRHLHLLDPRTAAAHDEWPPVRAGGAAVCGVLQQM